MTQAGPAIPVMPVTDRAADGGPALRVTVVSDGRPIEGGPARPVIVVSDGRPTQGNVPMPVVLATGVQASRVLAGPAIPVVVVSGSLNTNTPPANTVLPVISGTLTVGSLLSTTDGTWTGTPAPTYTYQWKRNGVAISGATANTYTLGVLDTGATITVTVTATNVNGSAAATSAGVAILLAYLLNDQFTTAQAAPLTTPRAAEPGPGTLTIVDTGNKLSINASNRLIAATATTAYTDPLVTEALRVRVPGRILRTVIKGGAWKFGFANTADTAPRSGVQSTGGTFFITHNATVTALIANNTTIDYDILVIQTNIGAFLAVKGGAWAVYTLLYCLTYNDSGLLNSAGSQKVLFGENGAVEDDLVQEYDAGGIWSRSYGWASYESYAPVLPVASFVATADLFIQLSWTMAAASIAEIYFRYVDDSNTWILRADSSTGSITLFEKNAGVETSRATFAGGITTATVVYMFIRAEGQTINFGYQAAVRGTYATATFQQTATGVKIPASTSIPFLFNVWPLTLPAVPTPPSAAGTAPLNLYPYGDSKTVGTGDSAAYAPVGSGYPWILCETTEVSRGAGCYERPLRTALGGRTTATAKAAVDAELAAKDGVPDYIIYNLGANDVSAMPVQATWETNTAYIWDAMHVKWPNAQIYVMRVWVRALLANCNTLATWQDNVMASRSAWVHVGPDERIFLENGDNGVTYTTDGIHPNHAGYVLTAAQWKASMGI